MSRDSEATRIAADRQLALALLGLHLRLFDPQALFVVLQTWSADRTQSLAERLRAANLLSTDECQALTMLLQRLLDRHQGDVNACVSELALTPATRAHLAEMGLLDLVPTLLGPSGIDTTLEVNDGDRRAAPAPATERPRFVVLRHHASGGLGKVSVAFDRELRREVALKEIRADRSNHQTSQLRFLLEAEITGSLEHPGIVPVYALGHGSDGRPYYAMRFIEGQSFREVIERFHLGKHRSASDRSLALRQLLRHFIDVCHAIDFAHSKRVLHRDLKPANVMIGKFGESLVVDWGMAKRLGAPELPPEPDTPASDEANKPGLTLPGVALGTPAYMSPEQAAGRIHELTPASDIYSLGASLYCVLTGLAPFVDRAPGVVLERVQKGDFLPPREVNRAIAPALQAVCLKAMALRPEDRYAQARDLADDLERWLADEPVRAFREGFIWKIRRWRRRHRTLTTSLLLLFVVMVVGGSLSGLLFQRQRQQQRAAQNVERLGDVSPELARFILGDLPNHRDDALPLLRERWEDRTRADKVRRRIGLALTDDAEVRAELVRLAETTDDPEEIELLAEVLQPHAAELQGSLWARLPNLPPKQRFRLLGLLATFDPHAPGWEAYLDETTESLLSANPFHIGGWARVLLPVRERLLVPLTKVFRDSPDAERRRQVATVLLDYARDRPETLTDLLLDADEAQWGILWPAAKGQKAALRPLFEREMTRALVWEWSDAAPPAAPLSQGIQAEIDKAEGLVHPRFVLAPFLPRDRLHPVGSALLDAGYRPLRLRPFTVKDQEFVASVWTCDGRTGGWLDSVEERGLEAAIARLATEQRQPCDLSFLPGPGLPRFLLTWVAGDPQIVEVRVQIGDCAGQAFQEEQKRLLANHYRPLTCHTRLAPAGKAEVLLWAKSNEVPGYCLPVCGFSEEYFGGADPPSLLQYDIDLNSSLWRESATHVSQRVYTPTLAAYRARDKELAAANWRPCALAHSDRIFTSVWQRPVIAERVRDRAARRQAHAAIALLLFGEPQHVLARLQSATDPRCRSWLIHRLRPLGADVGVLLDALAAADKATLRSGLLLALGTYPVTAIPPTARALVRQWYETDGDSGVHGAAMWLLRRWQEDTFLAECDARLQGKERRDGAGWRVNGQGQTLVALHAGKVWLGSPSEEEGRLVESEMRHPVKVDRAFEISDREVTVAQFLRFRPNHPYQRAISPHHDGPAVMVSWYEAAAYCNWLSEKEGLPQSEWCYVPNANKEYARGMKLAANYLERRGYRLPTEAEWVCACRAGTEAPYHFGSAESLLPHYARFGLAKVNEGAVRCGLHMPNDWGLFDLHGNVVEWCLNNNKSTDEPRGERDREQMIDDHDNRVLRGGSFNFLAAYLRCARSFGNHPGNHLDSSGFRVARTR